MLCQVVINAMKQSTAEEGNGKGQGLEGNFRPGSQGRSSCNMWEKTKENDGTSQANIGGRRLQAEEAAHAKAPSTGKKCQGGDTL